VRVSAEVCGAHYTQTVPAVIRISIDATGFDLRLPPRL